MADNCKMSNCKIGLPSKWKYGNPRRFQSHDVVRMEPGVRSRSNLIDGPMEKIETEGQKRLQGMLQKQMETKVTIQQQLGQKREFARGAEYRISAEQLTGTRSLGDFLAHGEVDDYIEEMKNYDLTHEEILYKLQMENKDSTSKRSRLSNPDYSEARLAEINEKIARKKQDLSKPNSFSNIKSLSRHEMELENVLATGSSQNRFLHKTLVQGKEDKSSMNPNDPMNSLPEILENFMKKGCRNSSRNKHRKDKSYKKECTLECCNPSTVLSCSKCIKNMHGPTRKESETCSSHDTSCDLCHKSCDHEMEVQTCEEKPADYVQKEVLVIQKKKEKKLPQKSTCFTVSTLRKTEVSGQMTEETNKVKAVERCNHEEININETEKLESHKLASAENAEEIRTLDDVEAIPEDVIRKYKLSADEVKKIPRFETYTPGEPSNVLFVKNLSPKVTEQDIASLFIQFQDDDNIRIVFKLLTGKMKGQAFVTFNSIDTASKAMELVHGYDFKGKPVIVQYGRRST